MLSYRMLLILIANFLIWLYMCASVSIAQYEPAWLGLRHLAFRADGNTTSLMTSSADSAGYSCLKWGSICITRITVEKLFILQNKQICLYTVYVTCVCLGEVFCRTLDAVLVCNFVHWKQQMFLFGIPKTFVRCFPSKGPKICSLIQMKFSGNEAKIPDAAVKGLRHFLLLLVWIETVIKSSQESPHSCFIWYSASIYNARLIITYFRTEPTHQLL